MRRIHIVALDKHRPAVILTRPHAIPLLKRITVAPITSTSRGIASEVAVSRHNGLDHASVISLDNITTVRMEQVLGVVGYLLPEQEEMLTLAVLHAFGLTED